MKKILFLLLFLISINASAGTYYVSTTGNDGNAGTISAPWKTWQFGFTSLTAGDTLYIRSGTYTDMYGSYSTSFYGVRITADGTAENPIVVMAYPSDPTAPVLDCSSLTDFDGNHYGIMHNSGDFWKIKGLHVKNVIEYNVGGIHKEADCWSLYGTNITIENCIASGFKYFKYVI